MEIEDRIIFARGCPSAFGAVIVDVLENAYGRCPTVRFRKLNGSYSALPSTYIQRYTSPPHWARMVAADPSLIEVPRWMEQ